MQVLIGVSIRLSDGQIVMTSNGVVIWGSVKIALRHAIHAGLIQICAY